MGTGKLLLAAGVLVPTLALAGPDDGVTTTPIQGPAPAAAAHISSFRIAEARKGSGYETGDLHIIYSDHSEVVEGLPAIKPQQDGDIEANEVGFDKVTLADDGRTAGWVELYTNCCTSYSIPLVLDVYRSGKTVLHISQGQMVWYWNFVEGGKKVVVVWGTVHGSLEGDFQLYDAEAGKLLGEVYSGGEAEILPADAPDWAKKAEQDCQCDGVQAR